MDHISSSSSDPVRNSLKLWRYTLGVETLSKAIQTLETQRTVDELDFQQILQEILLSGLREVFNSEGGFYTDAKGKFLFVEPTDSQLIGQTLSTEHIDKLLKDDSLVITTSEGIPSELRILGVRSLLVVPLDVPKYFIGVYNGKDDSDYSGDVYDGYDSKFFKALIETLGLGFRYGRIETETQLAYDRYLHAQRSGRYGFLSRASEDYAKYKLPLQSEVHKAHKKSKSASDDLLADYLDAELCKAIQDFELNKREQTTKNDATIIEKAETSNLPDYLLSLVRLSKKSQRFIVKLHDNNDWTKPLSPRQFHRTASVIARIGFWAGFIKGELRVPEWLDEKDRKLDSLPKELVKAKATDLFFTLPHWLLKVAKPDQTMVKKPHAVQWRIDWLRTQWQKIHYLARNGISEPRHEWVQEIVKTCTQARHLTACMLQDFLKAHETDGGLKVDSDWLIVWLANNVLLSRRLAEHYGLENSSDSQKKTADNKQIIASPSQKMRYFTHLSHLILYALHCTRHHHRRKEVKRRWKTDVTIERLPFAEVPTDLSFDLSEAQLYILSEYAYREIGVHRELVLLERLTRQLRYELPLYAASEFYRDHLYHVIDVCLLGELLLRSRVLPRSDGTPSSTLIDDFRIGTDCEHSRLLMQNWYIAALCHDLGYVVERTRNLLEPVRNIDGPGLDDFWKIIEDGLKSGDRKVKDAVETKLSNLTSPTVTIDDLKDVVATDHGIATWLHLNHWLEQIKESPKQYVHALNAVLRHNLPEQQVCFYQEPLTLLLMLCDHLQEWGRPRVGPDPLARGVMQVLRFSEAPEFRQKIRAKQLHIKGLKMIPVNQRDLISQACDECFDTKKCKKDYCPRFQTQIDGGLDFQLSHVESREGDFEPAISWLLLCRDLQCFDYERKKLPFEFKITFHHKPSRIWNMLPWKPLEMDLIQEFASEYEPATYLCEWVEKARLGNDGINYEGNHTNGLETFTLHLNQLGRPLTRGLSSEHWRQFFKWKWRRLGQQFIGLNSGGWFPEF